MLHATFSSRTSEKNFRVLNHHHKRFLWKAAISAGSFYELQAPTWWCFWTTGDRWSTETSGQHCERKPWRTTHPSLWRFVESVLIQKVTTLSLIIVKQKTHTLQESAKVFNVRVDKNEISYCKVALPSLPMERARFLLDSWLVSST